MRPEPLASPEAMLDTLRDHPEWSDTQREDYLGLIVERFPPDRVVAAVLSRLTDLGGPDTSNLLRLIEANPDPKTLETLAELLERRQNLPPDSAWEALAVLEGAGALDRHPALLERWNDLVELIDEEDPLGQLVEQIEGDPDGVWLALQGLEGVEPEIRAEIIEGLSGTPMGPGLVEFLRLLAYTSDPPTRAAALAVLEQAEPDSPGLADAWRDLAANHPDPVHRQEAARRVPGQALSLLGEARAERVGGRLARSLVTAVDGKGRASIVLLARDAAGPGSVTAAFVCDVLNGLTQVLGERTDHATAEAAFEELAVGVDRACLLDQHELALGLLSGCLWLGGSNAPPMARYWVEATAGGSLDPRPLLADVSEAIPFQEMPARAREILEACPDWVDDSPLTVELAEELLLRLRDGQGAPDPSRDSGAYRFLFERRLKGQLERYQRMLLWMSGFWRAEGKARLASSATLLAGQLSDAQHVVPGHPFAVALTTRSLTVAQARRRDRRGVS